MARISLCTRETLAEQDRPIFDRMEKERGSPVSNLFRTVAHAIGVLEPRLAYGAALRNKTILNAKYRELAIMTVGRLTESEYQSARHWRLALKAGVHRNQLEQLSNFATSSEFDEHERAVMQYAVEATQNIKVKDSTWKAIADFLNERELVELVLNVAWYNQTARVMVPLQIELEEWFDKNDIK